MQLVIESDFAGILSFAKRGMPVAGKPKNIPYIRRGCNVPG
jgi:hypothetical protein